MLLDNKLLSVLEEHEKEDEIMMGPFLEQTVLGDFEDAETILESFIKADLRNERSDQVKNGMLNMFRLGTAAGKIPTRIEHEFSIRKHTTHVEAYYHNHSYYEMLFVLRGQCVHYLWEDWQPVILTEMCICLLGPGVIHAMDAAGAGDLTIKVRIPIPLFHAASKNLGANLTSKVQEEKMLIRPNCPEQCFQLGQMLMISNLVDREKSESIIQSYLTLILQEYMKEPKNESSYEAVDQVMAYIRANMADASLKDCADALGYSSAYLSRMIRKQADITFRELLLKLRLQKAVERLTVTEEPIEQLGRSLGYKSTAGFYKSFFKVYGMTPGEYKKMLM